MEKTLLRAEEQYLQHLESTSLDRLLQLDLSTADGPWKNSDLMDDVEKSFHSLFTTPFNYRQLPELPMSLWTEESSIYERIKCVNIQGMEMILKAQDLTRPEDQPLHEIFVGYQLNRLELPFFARCFGGFRISGRNYVLYEKVNGKMITEYQLSPLELWTIEKILEEVIQLAHQKCGFVHQDLHSGNFLLVDLHQSFQIPVGQKIFSSRYLPVIIDYARNQVVVDGITYSPRVDPLPATIDYDLVQLRSEFYTLTNKKPLANQNTLYLYQIGALTEDDLAKQGHLLPGEIPEYFQPNYYSQLPILPVDPGDPILEMEFWVIQQIPQKKVQPDQLVELFEIEEEFLKHYPLMPLTRSCFQLLVLMLEKIHQRQLDVAVDKETLLRFWNYQFFYSKLYRQTKDERSVEAERFHKVLQQINVGFAGIQYNHILTNLRDLILSINIDNDVEKCFADQVLNQRFLKASQHLREIYP